MTDKDNWKEIVMKIGTAKPLTNKETRILQDAIDKAMQTRKQTFYVEYEKR